MAYKPRFGISNALLICVEAIAALRTRIQGAAVEVQWILALQKEPRSRNVHAWTASEGNPLTLEQMRALEEGRDLVEPGERAKREVTNYLAGLRYVEKRVTRKRLAYEDILRLHHILAVEMMDHGEAGRYRTIAVGVGRYVPPRADEASGLMFELLDRWNGEAATLSPVLSSAVLHYRFETIHPFADGNGRTGRALALRELYRRGVDTHHIFSVDEYYWEDRSRYYTALSAVYAAGEDVSAWSEYSAEGLWQTLERVWLRVQTFSSSASTKLVLRPRQERLLNLMRDQPSLAPSEKWKALGVSRQGAMDLLRPLLDAGLVEKIGSKKTRRYSLRHQ